MLNNTDFLRVLGQTLIKRPSCIWSGDPRLCHEPSNIATWLTQSCLGCLHKSPGRYTLTPGLPTFFGEFSGSALLHFCFRHPYHFWLFFWHNLWPPETIFSSQPPVPGERSKGVTLHLRRHLKDHFRGHLKVIVSLELRSEP